MPSSASREHRRIHMPDLTHPVGLVDDGSRLLAWVLDLPGCVAGARDREGLDAALSLAIAEHTAWLRTQGEAIAESLDWRIAERVDAREAPGDPCFAAERASVTPHELATFIARLRRARQDLLDAVADLPPAVLDWAPPLSAMHAIDPWAPHARTMRQIASHVVRFEIYYRDGLRDGPAKGIFERPGDPGTERARTLALLDALRDDDRHRVFRPLRPGQSAPEQWTVRKFVRRMISHDRAHAAEIIQRRTWILLGVPGSEAG